MEECKVCKQRTIIKKDGKYYNHCKKKKREDTLLAEDDFRDYKCEKFHAIPCEIVPYKRVEIFRANKAK